MTDCGLWVVDALSQATSGYPLTFCCSIGKSARNFLKLFMINTFLTVLSTPHSQIYPHKMLVTKVVALFFHQFHVPLHKITVLHQICQLHSHANNAHHVSALPSSALIQREQHYSTIYFYFLVMHKCHVLLFLCEHFH